ncbi:outer membrane beta-barrel protein [Opitutus sp. GAS368]|uniref:outer membrane beta-barrel protein n=1 Tax=Opitutus sp. GAS368 TaxID=1882749 RepID=UPI00087D26AC|nr:outer membrane beta-barrel protein [Opitutus sp. GAS368]SDS52512.1 Putative beta-barrel porin 2 [Opitutus sp. GAS368]
MIFPAPARTCLLGLAALLLGLPAAHALINLDGTRNQLFVFGSVTLAYDSNVFSDSSGRGDYTVTGAVGAEMKRRAGIIAVNATLTFNYASYSKYSHEDSFNPNLHVEFNKTTGRTTGAFTISAFRESRSDSAVNLRTNSWNFPLGLNLKYPVNDRYYFTSETTYLRRQYVQTTALANLTDYSQALDVFYVYTSRLDLVGGYRIRVSKTSLGSDSYDHWFNVGASGGLLAKLNGTVRLGYQIRDVRGTGQQSYANFNALAAIGWPVTRKLSLNGQLSRDFNTIATGASVDSTSAALNASYAFSRKVEFNAGLGYGLNRFLGTTPPPPPRRDTFFSFNVGARYKMNEHLQVGAAYTYFRNWSTFALSGFDRQGFSLDVSSRY